MVAPGQCRRLRRQTCSEAAPIPEVARFPRRERANVKAMKTTLLGAVLSLPLIVLASGVGGRSDRHRERPAKRCGDVRVRER